MLNYCQQAVAPDWERITQSTDVKPLHTLLATSQFPESAAGQPMPEIANADTVIIYRTSVQNLNVVLNNCRIGDDLSQVVKDSASPNTGYLCCSGRNEGVFFTNAAAHGPH